MSTENLTAAGKAEFEKTGVMPTETLIADERAVPDEMARKQRGWAIEWAIECSHDQVANRVVAMASAFVDFVNGTNDAEVLRAARELAGKVSDGMK